MNFEEFRIKIEKKLSSIAPFELIEFRYNPPVFGSGFVGYRIKGRNHWFVYDGKDNELTWQISEEKENLYNDNFSVLKKSNSLDISEQDLIKFINQWK